MLQGLQGITAATEAALYPPAVANVAAATGNTAQGGPSASPTKQVFKDVDEKTYDVNLLRQARKTLEALFGPEHKAVVEIDQKLNLYRAQQNSVTP